MDLLEYLTGAANGAMNVHHQIIDITSTWPIDEKMAVGGMAAFLFAYGVCRLAKYETESGRCVKESNDWMYSHMHKQ
jgi:hypothetical protein